MQMGFSFIPGQQGSGNELGLLFAKCSRLCVLLIAGGLAACGEPRAGYGWLAERDGQSYCLIPVMHLDRASPIEPRLAIAKCIDEASEVFVEVDAAKASFQDDYKQAISSYSRTLASRPIASKAEHDRARSALATRFPDQQIPQIDSTATDGQVVEFLVGTYLSWAGHVWGNSSEHQLTARARALGKPFLELESVQGQWHAIETSLQSQSSTLLEETIRKAEARELEVVLDAASTAWREKDQGRLVVAQGKLLSRYSSERVGFEHLIRTRDKKFADALASRPPTPGARPTVVLLGALHFVGEGNVLDRLRAHHFTINPLR